MERQKIAILGAGAFGQALGQVLLENGHQIIFYDPIAVANSVHPDITVPTRPDTPESTPSSEVPTRPDPPGSTPPSEPELPIITADLPTALKDADFILLAAPSAVVPSLLPDLPKDIPLIIATKGLMGDRLFQDFADYMAISGPGFALDIKNHRPTHLTATDPRVVKLFTRPYLDFDETTDVSGVLLCGTLKNVYAILAGLKNLQAGTPEHENFLTETSGEMQALLFGNNANPETAKLACGEGDLRITCAPPSRNYEFGMQLRADPKSRPTKTVEGATALKTILAGGLQIPENLPELESLLELARTW